MKKGKKENGRSMLEVIAVICLIILLLIGGLYGFKKITGQVQAKTLTERLLSIKNQHLLYGMKKSGRETYTKNGPLGSQLSIENGQGPQADYFWIIVNDLNAAVCDELPDSKDMLGAVKVDTTDCPAEVTFYFLKNGNHVYSDSDREEPNKDNQPLVECPTGYVDTEPHCNDNQVIGTQEVDGVPCYRCENMASCSEKSGYSETPCSELENEEDSFTLAGGSTQCYKCSGITSCTDRGYQDTGCDANQRQTSTFNLPGVGTCYKCEDLTSCSQKTGYTTSCNKNQKSTDSFTLAGSSTMCYRCTNLTSCSEKLGYSSTRCNSSNQTQTDSFTLAGTTTTCYKCENLTSCTQRTGYSATQCNKNQTIEDSFNLPNTTTTCYKCKNMTSCSEKAGYSTSCNKNQKSTDSFTLAGSSTTCYKCEDLTSCTQKPGYSATQCTNKQKITDSFTLSDGSTTCYACTNLTTCEAPLTTTACAPGETQETVTLTNGKVCYSCSGTPYTTCPSEYQTSPCDAGFTQSTITLKNGTTCYQCTCDADNTCGTQCCSFTTICNSNNQCVACPTGRNTVQLSPSTNPDTCENKCSDVTLDYNYSSNRYICQGICPSNTPLFGRFSSGSDTCIRCPAYGETVSMPYTEEGTCSDHCSNVEERYDEATDRYLCTGTCPSGTPLWNGTSCVACPTPGNTVSVSSSGVCLAACGGVETFSNGRYTCADASGMCQQAMTDAGFTQCSGTKTEECYTISGRDVHFFGKSDYGRMNVQKDLVMPSCNLEIDGHLYLYNYQELNMEVNNLTITSTTRGYDALEIARYAKNITLTVNGNLEATTTQSRYAVSLNTDGVKTLHVKGKLKASSGSSNSLWVGTKNNLIVDGDAELDGVVDIRGFATFNSNVKVTDEHFSGSVTAFSHTQGNSEDSLFIGGNLEVRATKSTAVAIIMNYNDIRIGGNVKANSSASDGFVVNFSGHYCDGTAGHVLHIGGNLEGTGGTGGDVYGVGICNAEVYVGGYVTGNTGKGTGCLLSSGGQLIACGGRTYCGPTNKLAAAGSVSCSSPNLYGFRMNGSSSKPCYLYAGSVSTSNRSDLTCRIESSNDYFYVNNQRGYRSGSCYVW